MSKSVGKNYIYNLAYQIFLILIPILVTPYVARILGEEGSGQYSFCFSITSYFLLFAQLGFNIYGQRAIAKVQNDEISRSRVFWEIVLARIFSVLATCFIYALLILFGLDQKYKTLTWILGINLVAVIFDISFFFQGMEEFGKIVIRSGITKLLSIICIFIFVKTENDLWIYALIQMCCIALSNILLWSGIKKYIVKTDRKTINPFRHFKATFILFLPTIATAIYTSLDKTMIGLITGLDSENGNYEYSEKIVKMALTVITSLGTVLTSRNAKKLIEGDLEGVRNNVYSATKFVFFVGVPLMLGSIAIADNFMPWYLGNGYDKAANLMKLLSPIILIIGLSNVFGLQYLVPAEKDKQFLIAIIVGAVTNFALNMVLIRFYQSYGAAIATVVAELVVTGTMFFFVRKEIKLTKILFGVWKYVLAGAIMFVGCYFVGRFMPTGVANTVVTVAVGMVLYAVCLLALRDKYAFGFIKKILKRKKNTNAK